MPPFWMCFSSQKGFASLSADTHDNGQVEVGLTGREGFVGASVMLNPVPVGCVLTVRLIGILEAKQRARGGDWIRNDRILAVATHAHTYGHVETIDDLRPHLLDEIEAFFEDYKEFKLLNRSGPKKAYKLLETGMAVFRERAQHEERKGAKMRGAS